MRRLDMLLAAGLLCAALFVAACGTDDTQSCTATAQTETGGACSDGIDNDCDGLADGSDSDCACTATAQMETSATCADGIDNDCDGFADGNDSDCGCVAGVEICDNVDNDCDSATDEDLSRDCIKDGQTGAETCAAGAWGDCQIAGPPPIELCNGADDNANGQVDEGLQRVCNTACGSGVELCIGGAWANCDAPAPQTEICDELDNDCDGQVDEDLTRECDSICGVGHERCSLGNWVGCDAPNPVAETCDNVDNDCDAVTDEDLSKGCTSACGEGAQICTAGQWSACSAPQPAAQETCGDGIDNDCDGRTDTTAEGCVLAGCEPGTQANCRGIDGTGLCQNGIRICGQNREFGPCQFGAATLADPMAESCNGRDDDCDGGTDEEFPGKDGVCGAGPNDGPLEVGECQNGVWACVSGQVVCQGRIAPVNELCDELDNDCDGGTDNGMPGDQFESNGTCASARANWSIAEDSDALNINGTIYPQGDVDMFLVKVEEGSSTSCIAWPPVDNPYSVTFALYNIPEGVDYDLCVTVDWAEGLLGDPISMDNFCGEPDPIVPRTCFRDAQDGVKGGVLEITEAVCFVSDDIFVLLEVIGHGQTDTSCQPYTLSIFAEGLPTP